LPALPPHRSRRAVFSHRALQTASLPQTIYCFVLAIPHSEVCLGYPALHVRPRFPLWAPAVCQSLPHTCTVPQVLCVIGPTVSEYYGLIRLPGGLRLSYLLFRVRLPASCQESSRVSQVLNASLHASHTLSGPRQILGALTIYALSVLASEPLTSLPSAFGTFRPLAP